MRWIDKMNVFQFEVKRLIKSCITWSVVCGILIILFMSFYPSMKDSGIQELVETKLNAFPEGMMQAIGLDEMVDFTDIIEYMAYIIQYISMATAIYASILGVNSLLEEEAMGTIEFLYAQPISRTRIVMCKIFSRNILLVIYLIIIGLVTTFISIILKPTDLNIFNMVKDIINIFAGMAFVGFIFLSIGLFLSTILKPNINSTAISIGFFFITYVMGVISKLRDGLEPLRILSPFDYALPMDLAKEGWNLNYVLLGTGIIILSTIGTFISYNRKDMKI